MARIAIGAVMKQEAPYILEWVYYHRALGFELIIADNGGQDDTSKLLTALHNAKVITRIDFRFKKNLPQFPAYRAILRLARQKKIDIIGFLDCDEFFTRNIPIRALTPEFGAEYIESEFKRLNATQLSYYWLCYGSKTDKTDLTLPVLERFTYHSINEPERHAMFDKSFSKVSEIFKFSNVFFLGPKVLSPHHLHGANKRWYLDGQPIKKFYFDNQKVTHNNGAILHFRIKSWEEYQKKVSRGRSDIKPQIYTDKLFRQFDLNDVSSEIDQKLIDQIKAGINQLNVIIGNYTQIDTKTSLFSTLIVRLMSIGLSDVENHKLVHFVYKFWKKRRESI